MAPENVREVKTPLSRLLDQAMAGEDVIVVRADKPVVRLVPAESASLRRALGTGKDDFVVPDDFNDPLPDEILAAFEGRKP